MILSLGELGFDKGTRTATYTITLARTLIAGDVIVIYGGAVRNTGTAVNPTSVTDSQTNTWALIQRGAYAVVTNPLGIGDTFTITYSTASTLACVIVTAYGFRGFSYPTTAAATTYIAYLTLPVTLQPAMTNNSASTDTHLLTNFTLTGALGAAGDAAFLLTHDYLTGVPLGQPAGGVHVGHLYGMYGTANPTPTLDNTSLASYIELASDTSLAFGFGTTRNQTDSIVDLSLFHVPCVRVDRPGFNTALDMNIADGTSYLYTGIGDLLTIFEPLVAGGEDIGRLPLLGAG